MLPTEVRADSSIEDEYWDYPGRDKVINDFESLDLASEYGYWIPELYTPYQWISSEVSLVDAVDDYYPSVYQGAHALQYKTYDGSSAVNYPMTMHFETLGMVGQVQTISIVAKGLTTFNSWNNPDPYSEATVWLYGKSLDESGAILESQLYTLTLDNEWREFEFDRLYAIGATKYTIDVTTLIENGVNVSTTTKVFLDHMTAQAPPCDVRFSFYNEYTGLGMQSELLIPEINYNGNWIRVYDGHQVFGAGEMISYRVSDYFGQIIVQSNAFVLNEPVIYLDIPVKLVKVQIAKPDWWSSSLPPEWQLMYLPTGRQINISGWELEVLAGWYNFRWGIQKVTNSAANITDSRDEIVVDQGSVDTWIDGNISTAHSYSLQNFFLTMQPTTSGIVSGENNSMVLPSLDTLDGIIESLNVVVDEISTSTEYKAAILIAGLVAIIGLVYKLVKTRSLKATLTGDATKRKGGN